MNRPPTSLLLTVLSFVAACGDDNPGPSNASVAGTYQASTITLTPTGGAPQDGLALGFSVDIVLTPQGTTTGTLVVPALFTEGGVDDDVIDLTGTYTINGNTLTFQVGDNLFQDQAWSIGDGILTANNPQPEGTLEVTLTRS